MEIVLESLKCEVIVELLAKYLPLLCEVIFVLVVPCLCERLYSVERGVVYSQIVIAQILNGGSLCGKFCVDDIVEIFLCEGGYVEQWLEPRNISLCLRLFHYLYTPSLILCIASYFSYHIYAWVCLCAILVLNQESFI